MILPPVRPVHVPGPQVGRDLHQICLKVVHGLFPVLLVKLVHAGHDCASDANIQLLYAALLILHNVLDRIPILIKRHAQSTVRKLLDLPRNRLVVADGPGLYLELRAVQGPLVRPRGREHRQPPGLDHQKAH